MHFRRLLRLETRRNMASLFIEEIELRMPQQHELEHLCESLSFQEERRLRFFINTENRAGVVNVCNDILKETNRQLRQLLKVEG